MKIAILGTRGVPNNYGGFEQFAEFLSKEMAVQGHDVYVYNSHNHPFQEKVWDGVKLIHKYDPEFRLGTAGQFVYDLNCVLHSRNQNFDIILQLGYTSSSIWHWLMPKKSIIATNMDGLEWMRTKFSPKVQKFLKYAEKLGATKSDYLISDSIGIQKHIKNTYGLDSEYIAYGADVFDKPNNSCLTNYDLTEYNYNLLIARLEPENNIETILDGVDAAKNEQDFLVIGKHETEFGNYLKNKFKHNKQIRFLGGIYNHNTLDNLRYYSRLYYHGHSVGGTNPSLLEAMASSALICANKNDFNYYILEEDAFYFENSQQVIEILDRDLNKLEQDNSKVKNNISKINTAFTWKTIVGQYISFLDNCLKKGKNRK